VSPDEFLEWAQAAWELSNKQDLRRYLGIVFISCDTERKGSLNKKQFLKFMKFVGAPVGFLHRTDAFKAFDTNASGTVELSEIVDSIQFVLAK
jgi:Ca2+-binding EF-hand superfamily protein